LSNVDDNTFTFKINKFYVRTYNYLPVKNFPTSPKKPIISSKTGIFLCDRLTLYLSLLTIIIIKSKITKNI